MRINRLPLISQPILFHLLQGTLTSPTTWISAPYTYLIKLNTFHTNLTPFISMKRLVPLNACTMACNVTTNTDIRVTTLISVNIETTPLHTLSSMKRALFECDAVVMFTTKGVVMFRVTTVVNIESTGVVNIKTTVLHIL